VPLPPMGSIGPWGAGRGGVKNSKKWGVVSFVQWTATISIFLSASKCGSICRAQTCALCGVEPSRWAKLILQGGPKSSKKIRIFHHFETLRPYISETIKIEAYKQRTEKSFIFPLSNYRMCMDPSLTGFYRVGQKLSDVIPVLQITPRATEPSTISVFLSVVNCGRICRAQTCAHSGIEPSSLAKGFLQGTPKTFKKFRIFEHSRFYVPISQQQLQLQAYDQSGKNPSTSPIHMSHLYQHTVSPTAFYRLGQKVSDTIPILRIMAIAPDPTTISVCSECRQVRSNM